MPRTCTLLLIVGLALGACSDSASDEWIHPSQRAQPPGVRLRAAPSSAVEFRFDWPERGPRVEEARWDLRRSHLLRYGISLTDSVVRQHDLQVLQLSGRDPADPSIARLAPLIRQTLVAVQLTHPGRIARPVDRVSFFEANTDLLNTAGAQTERIPPNSLARAAFEFHSTSYWNAWCGWFAELDLAPGESINRSIPLQVGESVVEIPATIENRGAVDGDVGGHWHLVARGSAPSPVLGAAATAVLLPWLADQRLSGQSALAAAARARLIIEAETVTTTSLRPRWAFHRIALEFGGELARVEDVERTLYSFDWAE